MSQAALADFFFTSDPSVVKLECFEISHPSFSQAHRVCRNSGADIEVKNHATQPGVSWIFDGVDDTATAGNVSAMSPTATTPFSVSAWWTGTSEGAIFSKMDILPFARGWTIYVLAGRLYAGLFNDDSPDIGLQGLGNTVINDGNRHHCLLTYDGSTNLSGFRLYVDNVLQTLTAPVDNLAAGNDVQTTEPVLIGSRDSLGYLAGRIEHCSYWSKQLDATDRSQIYNGGVPPDLTTVTSAANLVAWYVFDDQDVEAVDGIQDRSGNGHHATPNFGSTEDQLDPLTYTYYPMQIKHIGTTNSLDQKMEVTFGDMGELLPQELSRVSSRNTFHTRPVLAYREYRSDLFDSITTESEWVFDGVNDIVSMGNVLAFERNQTFTVMAWANLSNPATSTIIGKVDASTTRGYVLFYLATGQLRFRVRNNATGTNSLEVQSVGSFNDGLVHHVSATYAGTSSPAGIVLYVDGVSVPFTIVANALTATIVGTASLIIGASQNGTTSFQAGIVKHVSIWNAALSAANVLSAYGSGTPPDLLTNPAAANLRGWWKLDITDSTVIGGIEDHSTNNNHGTAAGGLTPTESASISFLSDPIYGPLALEMDELRFTKTGCTFTAKAKSFNKARMGETYDVGRFPMLRGFL